MNNTLESKFFDARLLAQLSKSLNAHSTQPSIITDVEKIVFNNIDDLREINKETQGNLVFLIQQSQLFVSTQILIQFLLKTYSKNRIDVGIYVLNAINHNKTEVDLESLRYIVKEMDNYPIEWLAPMALNGEKVEIETILNKPSIDINRLRDFH